VERGLTRFVGRDVELAQIRSAQQLAGYGRGQVMAIVGEAGVGKSRLVSEFIRPLHGAVWLILQSNSPSYGQATPYLPITELLRHYFKISIQETTQSIRDKVTARILALDSSLLDSVPPVLDLLDALDGEHPFRSLDPLQHRQHTYQAVTQLMLREAQ